MNITINNIIIEELFGHYNYNIRKQNKEELDMAKLLILYGDNGCGKTTILRLIYDIISVGSVRGRQNLLDIARTKFKRFSVIFNDGYSINAERKGKEYIGKFTLNVRNDAEIIHEFIFTEDDDVKIIHGYVGFEDEIQIKRGYSQNKNQKEFINIYTFLRSRNTSIYYLTDKRKLNFSYNRFNSRHYLDDKISINNAVMVQKNYLAKTNDRENELEDKILINTLEEATRWIREQSIRGSLRGEEDTNSIYKDIIKRISTSGVQDDSNINDSNRDIMSQLEDISECSKAYSKFGLISLIEYNDFKKLMLRCSAERKAIINNVLEPYVNGLNARIKALKDTYDILNTFVNSINEYFNHQKYITFDINEGFKIYYINGDEIKPNCLSSGEKQLFLLFCNALLAEGKATIFLIDEPEISLNIKWQRKLIDTLLEFGKNNQIQYIIASHSMEILASHRNNIGKLFAVKEDIYGKN